MDGRTLLVTSIGGGVGRAIVDAAALSPHHYVVTGLSTEPVSLAGAAVVAAPPTRLHGAFRAAVIDALAGAGRVLVLAGRDEDTAVLAGMAEDVRAHGGVFPSAPAHAVVATFDKGRTAGLLGGSVAFAPVAVTRSGARRLAARVGWPLVVKPRRGSASHGVRVVRNTTELLEAMSGDVVAQAYVPVPDSDARPWDGMWSGGQDGEYSVQILLGPTSNLIGWCATRNTLADGRPVIAETVAGRVISDVATSVAAALASRGATGPWNVQGRLDGRGHLRAFEVNARTTGITGLRASLGFNEVDLLYDAFMLGSRRAAATVEAGLVLDASRWTNPALHSFSRS
jgi:hypothetical protein